MSSQLGRSAAYAALRVRHRAGIALTDPADPVDIAESIGVQVWYRRLPSMEGMFIQTPAPQILLSSLRPAGRTNFTCAHELGHHWFGHAAHVDARVDGSPLLLADNEDEFQANAFATSLLMPKTTTQHGFVRCGTTPNDATPRQVLAVAHWLGVGYSTLVHHLHRNLGLLDDGCAALLLKKQPKGIVGDELGGATGGFVVVDRFWRARPIDLQVGDVAIVEGHVAVTGACVSISSTSGDRALVQAECPGTGHLNGGAGWSSYVRVRRLEFEGRSIFKHLEDEADAEK